MQVIGNFFSWIMYFCYRIVHNYGLAIILFTLITKVILLPVSLMVQKNSIKMVKMYPQINRIKAKYYGNKDMISEEQYQLYKKEQYHPTLDLLPVFLQLIILMGVVGAIYNPSPGILMDYHFLELDLGIIPSEAGGASILIPILAAFSAWIMCAVQNRVNVLQSEQGRINKTVTMLISVAISLYLGFFVPAGVGFYWTVSNLMSIAQLYMLNYLINPRKYIDYEDLEASKKELDELNKYIASSKKKNSSEYAALEKTDYKRFMKYGSKQLVFYAERNGFYKYFKNVIELILKKTDITIHYITSDPADGVFGLQSDNFRVYYIGENKLIILMMKMDADIVVMTTPDLQKYHLKRSMIRNDIEYIYMDHAIGSVNLQYRKHALDYFDTIFVPNEITLNEIQKQEEVYSLNKKNIVKYGYGLIDEMIAAYEKEGVKENHPKIILIAPSWQKDNLLDLCVDEVLQNLLGKGYMVILRPHPQYVRYFEEKLQSIETKYKNYDDFTLQWDFSSNDTVFNADILITDWSGIAYEYSFTTLKPTLFIDTPMKVMNPDYEEIGITPFDIIVRNQIGVSISPEEVKNIPDVVSKLLSEEIYSEDSLREIRNKYLYNITESAKVGADYIIRRLIEYSKT